MGNYLGVKMDAIERLIGGFRQGDLYAFATRPGCGKTHFCMSVACHFAKLSKNVLYISDSLNREIFEARMDIISPTRSGKVVFKECYKLTIDRLSEWLKNESFDLLVIDPFNAYCFDVDIGELKELAQEIGIPVLLSKNISAESSNDNEPLALSHIRFPSESILDKFIAYTSVILFGFQTAENDTITLKVAKNIYGSIGQAIQFKK